MKLSKKTLSLILGIAMTFCASNVVRADQSVCVYAVASLKINGKKVWQGAAGIQLGKDLIKQAKTAAYEYVRDGLEKAITNAKLLCDNFKKDGAAFISSTSLYSRPISQGEHRSDHNQSDLDYFFLYLFGLKPCAGAYGEHCLEPYTGSGAPSDVKSDGSLNCEGRSKKWC